MKNIVFFVSILTISLSSCYRDIYSEEIDGYIKGTIKGQSEGGTTLDESFKLKLYTGAVSGIWWEDSNGNQTLHFTRSDDDKNEIEAKITRSKDGKINEVDFDFFYLYEIEKDNHVLNLIYKFDYKDGSSNNDIELTEVEFDTESGKLKGKYKATAKNNGTDMYVVEGSFSVHLYKRVQ